MSKKKQEVNSSQLTIPALILLALLLLGRLGYLYLGDPQRYPINTIKITASYKHISHHDLEKQLRAYQQKSFFTFPTTQLQKQMSQHPWAKSVQVERIWPDSLKLTINEKQPIAIINNRILTDQYDLINDQDLLMTTSLPRFKAPLTNLKETWENYKKMQAILSKQQLQIEQLSLDANQAFELKLQNNILVKLGKSAPLAKLQRFVIAYPQLQAHAYPLLSVDLRYPNGMAVKRDGGKATS